MTKTLIIKLLLLLALSLSWVSATAQLRLVTTIKPLQLIAEAITSDRVSSQALFPPNQSPHHFSLSPSDLLSLRKADIVIWVGPQLETFLAPTLSKLPDTSHVIEALRIPGLQVRNLEGGQLDPHFWLSPANALILGAEIKALLTELDTANASQYQINYENFEASIQLLDKAIKPSTAELARHRYLVYHDAYSYLENYYGFKHELALLNDPEASPGIKHIIAVREKIADSNAECLYLEIDANQSIVKTLLADETINTVTLDLMGQAATVGNSGYVDFIETLIREMQSCFN